MICPTSPAPTNRIRRTAIDAVFENQSFRASATLTIPREGEVLELRYHRSRWHRDPDFGEVQQREVRGRLYVDGNHAGSFKLTEVRPEPFIGSRAFLEWADALSEDLTNLAEIICGHWDDVCEVSDYGTILQFDRAWMNPTFSRGKRFALATDALLGLSEEWSLLVLKAFPLEYQGLVAPHLNVAYTRRLSAMMRHYHSIMGVTPFPGGAGNEGWMYLIRAGLNIEPPSPCSWGIEDLR